MIDNLTLTFKNLKIYFILLLIHPMFNLNNIYYLVYIILFGPESVFNLLLNTNVSLPIFRRVADIQAVLVCRFVTFYFARTLSSFVYYESKV